MSTFLTAERIVSTALGLLVRDTVLPQLVWRDAGGDFAGAKNDTISLRLPAYASARTRALRSGTARTRDELDERKVDVTLDTDVYKDVKITDEQLTLDIGNFGEQVLNPVLGGVVRQLEQELADTITGATYDSTVNYTGATDDPYADMALEVRRILNNAHVPPAGRTLLTGSTVETDILSSDRIVDASQSGSAQALREATIGRFAGMNVISSTLIPPNEAYAFHRTAYVMSNRAPIVPAGAPFGESRSFGGFAVRMVRVLDSTSIEDILATDSWVGTNTVADDGHWTGDAVGEGEFVPVEDPDNPNDGGTANPQQTDQPRLVRAVKITRS